MGYAHYLNGGIKKNQLNECGWYLFLWREILLRLKASVLAMHP
jgi:hypothetical protein